MRTRAFTAVLWVAALLALAPAECLGAVPQAKWWWTLAVSRSDPDTLLLATSNGLYRSTDSGKTWHAAGMSGLNVTSLTWAGDQLFAGGVRLRAGTKPVVVEGNAYTTAPGHTVLAVSNDDGVTWHRLHPGGLPGAGVQALAADPANQSALYAVVHDGGLYRSNDGGRSFTLVTDTVGGTPWAVAAAQGRFVAGDMTSGSYVSGTGKRWLRTRFADARGGSMVMEYAVQPTNPRHVLMTSYGVVASNDAGKSWHTVLRSKVMFGPVAWAPSMPSVAYAVGWDRSVWRSDDGGKTWTGIS